MSAAPAAPEQPAAGVLLPLRGLPADFRGRGVCLLAQPRRLLQQLGRLLAQLGRLLAQAGRFLAQLGCRCLAAEGGLVQTGRLLAQPSGLLGERARLLAAGGRLSSLGFAAALGLHCILVRAGLGRDGLVGGVRRRRGGLLHLLLTVVLSSVHG